MAHGFYVRDRWNVNQKVTVDLGLRYEYYPLMTRADRGIEQVDLNTLDVLLGGLGGNPDDLGIKVSKTLFAPRLGLAYRLNDDTVFRTGYGLTFNPLPFARPLRGFYPANVGATFQQNNPAGWYGTLANGIPDLTGPDLSSAGFRCPTTSRCARLKTTSAACARPVGGLRVARPHRALGLDRGAGQRPVTSRPPPRRRRPGVRETSHTCAGTTPGRAPRAGRTGAGNRRRGALRCLSALALADLSGGAYGDVVEHALAAAALTTRSSKNLGIAAPAATYAGDLDQARRLNSRMVAAAVSPTLRAFGAYVDGEIANAAGRTHRADEHYARAIDLAHSSGATFVIGIASVGRLTVKANAGHAAPMRCAATATSSTTGTVPATGPSNGSPSAT